MIREVYLIGLQLKRLCRGGSTSALPVLQVLTAHLFRLINLAHWYHIDGCLLFPHTRPWPPSRDRKVNDSEILESAVKKEREEKVAFCGDGLK